MDEKKKKRHQDPNDKLNSEKYHTGKLCIEGCGRPAGTAWSPHWCQPCNAVRMDQIEDFLRDTSSQLTW